MIKVSLPDLVLVMFTARWCNLCIHSEGRFRSMGERVEGDYFRFIVDVDDEFGGGRGIALRSDIDEVCSPIWHLLWNKKPAYLTVWPIF